MWLGTSVGMPMPRLTYCPSWSSRATRAASWSFVSAMSAPALGGPHGPLLDPLLGTGHVHDPLHEDPGGVDQRRVELTGLDELLHLGDRDPPGGGAQRV